MKRKKDKGLDVLERWIRENEEDFDELFSFEDEEDIDDDE
jgi:hypothetical protein